MPNQSFKVTPVNPIPGFPAPPDPKPPPSNRKGVWRETIVSWHNAHVHGCLGHRDTWQTTPRCRCIPELTFWSLSRRFFFRLPIPSCQCFLGKKTTLRTHHASGWHLVESIFKTSAKATARNGA